MDLLADAFRTSAAGLGCQGAAGEVGADGAAGQSAAQDLPPVVRVEADEDERVERSVQSVNHVDEDEGEVLRRDFQDVHDDVRPIQQQVGQDEHSYRDANLVVAARPQSTAFLRLVPSLYHLQTKS